MLKSIKISVKDTIIYGLGNIAVKIVGLILIPLYTDPKFFSTDEFGVLGMLEITGLVLTALLASGLPQSLTRWYWDKEHRDNQRGIFFMALVTQVIISLAFCLVLVPLSGKLSSVIFSTTNWSEVIKYVVLASALQAVNNIVNTLMRLQSRSMLYTLTNLFKLVTVLSLTLFFILSSRMGLKGIYLAQVIGNALTLVALIGYAAKNCRVYFNKAVFSEMSAYGFPLLIANVSAALFAAIDRFSLNSMSLLKSVALYTLAFKLTSVLKLVLVDSVRLALGPMMLKKMDSPDNKRFYSKVLLYTSWVMMIAVVGMSLFSYEMIKVIATSRDFWGAVAIIPILSLSIFFVNMKEVTVYGLHIAKKTHIIGIIVIFSTILSLALNILLIPWLDITGAALATLLSQFIYWLACYYYSQKEYYVPYEIDKIIIMLITGSILSFASLFLNNMALIPRLLIKTGALISFPFILYLFKFYEPVELQAIKGFIIKWTNFKNLGANLKSLRGMRDDF